MDNLTNIIIENDNLIQSLIGKYCKFYDYDDLYQVAAMGMIKAYYKFDDKYQTKFTTYAYTYMLGEIFKYISNSNQIKISNDYLTLYKKINDTKNILTQKLMKEPSTFELSIYLEIDEKLIIDVINAKQQVDSLDKIISEDGKNILLQDVIPAKKDEYNIDNLFLNSELEKLSSEERELIKARYYQDKTQSEVANYLGINQVQVSRNEQKILKKLKNNFEKVA